MANRQRDLFILIENKIYNEGNVCIMSKEKEYCVYKHTAPNGKVYIGQTCQKPEQRWKNGNGYSNNEYFTRAIQKYGWGNFEHEILYNGLTKDEANMLEIELIKKYDSTNKDYGYNLEHGGYGKGKHSIETLKKMSENRKGILAWNKGLSMSKEQKEKLSEIAKGKPSAFKGKHHTDENKKMLSDLQSEKMKSVICIETKIVYKSLKEAEIQTNISRKAISKVCNKKIINGKRFLTAGGYHWCFLDDYNENTYAIESQKITPNQKSVICVETGVVYESLKDAENKTGIYMGTISKVCNKIEHYKTAGGFHWMFYDEYLLINKEAM